jgi:SAM-dependent methyltransferase
VREYDLIAEWYASERTCPVDGSSGGVPEARALAASLHQRSRILDVGCGNGIPLTQVFLAGGHDVVGLDSSAEMLARFQVNCSATPAVRARVQQCPFRDASFDGALAWGMMFHLPQRDQIEAIASVSRVLKAGAPFLFTAGDEDDDSGTHVGVMNGVEFHYYSFRADDYRRILADHGCTLLDRHHDSGENLYYLARKLPDT